MKLLKLLKYTSLVLMFGIFILSCQKMNRPVLGDYPKDANAPGGALKFYAALDGTPVDSIRAQFGNNNDVSYVPGVSGKAVQFDGTKNGFVAFPTANDFGKVTSFTISFWLNTTPPDSICGRGKSAISAPTSVTQSLPTAPATSF